jgi:hypothetical protein
VLFIEHPEFYSLFFTGEYFLNFSIHKLLSCIIF